MTAYARVELGRARAAAGDADTAERLYRHVARVVRAAAAAPSCVRALFVAIAGSPATGALLGLADLAAARGDAEAADELRARAELAAA